jgi:hypothetical protein
MIPKIPRNIIENDPSWLAMPSVDPQIISWVNNSLNLLAQCNSNEDSCHVTPYFHSEPILPNFLNYRNFITSGNNQNNELRKYLSSSYLNQNRIGSRYPFRTGKVDLFTMLHLISNSTQQDIG